MAKTFFIWSQGGQVFSSQTKKHRKRICLVDQLPCGSVVTPAISCARFKIHSAHADSPIVKTFFSFCLILGRTGLCFTDQDTQEENVLSGPTHLCVGTYTSYLSYKVQDPFSACRQSCGQNNFSSSSILGSISLYFRDKETQEENVLSEPTTFRITAYTSYLLYKVQDPFSTCRHFHSSSIFAKDKPCFPDRDTEEENISPIITLSFT